MQSKRMATCAYDRRSHESKSGTCFLRDELLEMAKRAKLPIKGDESDDDLIALVKKHGKCGSDSCLFDIYFNDRNWNDYFKPVKDDFSDLVTDEDIDNIFIQVMKKYPWLYVVTPVFSDMKPFTSSYELSLPALREQGKSSVAIVINHDVHTGPGTHWVSVFIDNSNTKKGGETLVYYFDSFGKNPPKTLLGWMRKLNDTMTPMGIKTRFFVNKTVHQADRSTQCGVYAIHFVTSMAEGKSFEEFINSDLSEAAIVKLRWDKYFSQKRKKR